MFIETLILIHEENILIIQLQYIPVIMTNCYEVKPLIVTNYSNKLETIKCRRKSVLYNRNQLL